MVTPLGETVPSPGGVRLGEDEEANAVTFGELGLTGRFLSGSEVMSR
jgi:hypothetical protein